MMLIELVQPGDLMAVFGPRDFLFPTAPSFIYPVVKVNKRFIQLSDGSRWSLNGRRYPKDDYNRCYLEPLTSKIREDFDRRQLWLAVQTRWAWLERNPAKLNLQQLQELEQLLRRFVGDPR